MITEKKKRQVITLEAVSYMGLLGLSSSRLMQHIRGFEEGVFVSFNTCEYCVFDSKLQKHFLLKLYEGNKLKTNAYIWCAGT